MATHRQTRSHRAVDRDPGRRRDRVGGDHRPGPGRPSGSPTSRRSASPGDPYRIDFGDSSVEGVIVDVQPGRRFAHTWRWEGSDADEQTLVSWTVEAAAGGGIADLARARRLAGDDARRLDARRPRRLLAGVPRGPRGAARRLIGRLGRAGSPASMPSGITRREPTPGGAACRSGARAAIRGVGSRCAQADVAGRA